MSLLHRVDPTRVPTTSPPRRFGFKPLIAASVLVASLVMGGLLTRSARAAFLYHGTLLVANRGGSPPSILRIDTATDTVLQTITQADVSDPNNSITDVQVDTVTGNIFVAVDLNGGNDDPLLVNVGGTGEVVVFDPFGVYLRTVPMPNDGPGSDTAEAQHSPMGIDIDVDGSIWATLPASLQIVRVANNSLGTILGQFDLSAAGARGPTDVHVSPTPGHVFVSDLDPDGNFPGQLFEVDYTTIPTTVTKRADGSTLGPLPPAARPFGAAARKLGPAAKRKPGDFSASRFQFPTMAGGFMSVEIEFGALVVSTDDGRVASFDPNGTGAGILLNSYNFGDGVPSLDTVYDPDTNRTFVPRLFNNTVATLFGGPIYTGNGFAPGGPIVFPAGVAIAADPQASLRYSLNPHIGDAYVGQSVTQTLTITNESANPVTVTGVFIASGSADFSVDPLPGVPFVLQPGGNAFYTIRFTPMAGETGTQNAVLRVTSTDPVEPVVNFNITGTVLTPTIATNPPAGGTLAFGDICLGSNETQVLDISNVGDSPLTITNIAATGAGVTISAPATPFNLAPGAHAFVNVTVTPQSSGMLVGGSVVITSNSGGTSGNTTVNVSANTPTGVMTLQPASLDFGPVCLGEDSTLDVDVYNTGTCDLTLAFVSQPADPAYTLVAPPPGLLIQPGDHATIPVTFTPAVAGTTSSTFLITTDDGSGVTNTSYSVTGEGAVPTITAFPMALAFGDVCPGVPESRTFQILNDGDCPATINSIAKVGGVNADSITLAYPALPFTLQAGSTFLVEVTVNAQVPTGAISTTVRTNINDSPVNTDVAVSAVVTPQSIAFTPTALNFGDVCAGMTGSRVLTIRNTGGCDLTVSNVAVTSGGAVYSVEPVATPLVIASGGSAPVTVVFAPNGVGDGQAGVLTVTSNTGGAAGTTSNIALTGDAPAGTLNVSPSSVAFGNVCVGGTQSRVVTLRNTGECDLTVSNVAITAGGSVYSIEPSTTPVLIPRTSSVPVTVVFSPTAVGLAQTGVLTVTSDTGGAAGTTTNVPLTGDALPGVLTVSPSSVAFGNVCAGDTQSRVVSLRNTGECDLTVSNVAITAGSAYSIEPFTTPVLIPRAGSAPVTVVFAPSAVGLAQTGVLTVTSNTGGAAGTTTNVPLTGDAPPGVLSVSPTSLDFGTVVVGSSTTRNLQISNTGPCDLTLTTASFAGIHASDYSTDLVLPINLAPGAGVTAHVTLTPSVNTGPDAATLTLMTSDANTVVVPLTANFTATPTIVVSGVSGDQGGNGTAADPYVVCVGASPPLTFTVTGTDADAGDTLTLTESGAPAGFGYTNPLPATGNPVSTTVTFSPSVAQAGQTYPVTFTVTDDSDVSATASTTVHIRVSGNPTITATPSTLPVCEGMPIEFRVRATDEEPGNVTIGVPTTTSPEGSPPLNLVSTPGLPHSGNPAETVVTGTAPQVASDTVYTLTYTATDSDGCTATQVVTVTVMNSSPTTITMTRNPSGDIAVDQEVCFTAVVRDDCPEPRLVAGVPVCFVVTSSTGNNTPVDGVHVTTDANGEARYCLTPQFPGTITVTAVIDFNGDCVADTGTQGATMNLTVAAPVQLGPGCYATGRGKVDAADPLFGTAPVPATFNFDVSPKRNGTFSGAMSFVVPGSGVGRRGNITIRSTRIESMLCADGPSGLTAVIFGQGKITGHPDVTGRVRFRIDALDAGTPGVPNDRFTLTLLSPAGDILAGPVGGSLAFGRGGARPQDDIKIRSGVRRR